MTQELSTAKFIALLSLRVDLGKPRRIPDPLPKAKETLTMAGINGSYSKGQWQASARSTEKAVEGLGKRPR